MFKDSTSPMAAPLRNPYHAIMRGISFGQDPGPHLSFGEVRGYALNTAAKEIAAREFDRVAQDFKKHANLPGFRRGKAPLSLIKRRFEGDIRGEVVQKLVPESYEQAIKDNPQLFKSIKIHELPEGV